jgi:hypothetical protein
MATPEPEITEAQVAAAQADAEVTEPEPETSDAPEPAPEPEPEPEPDTEPESGAMMEAMGKQLDQLQKHVATRIGKILGDQATEWEECEVCSYWGTPGWRHKGPLPSEVEDVVRAALGQHSLAALKKDQYSDVCTKCDGEGFVSTGSKVPGQQELPCLNCKGLGWVPTPDGQRSGGIFTPNGPQLAAVPPTVAAQPAEPDPPEVAALKAQGYMVIAPFQPA